MNSSHLRSILRLETEIWIIEVNLSIKRKGSLIERSGSIFQFLKKWICILLHHHYLPAIISNMEFSSRYLLASIIKSAGVTVRIVSR